MIHGRANKGAVMQHLQPAPVQGLHVAGKGVDEQLAGFSVHAVKGIATKEGVFVVW